MPERREIKREWLKNFLKNGEMNLVGSEAKRLVRNVVCESGVGPRSICLFLFLCGASSCCHMCRLS